MSKFWSDAIKHLVPYVPGEQPKAQQIVKLNTNENPYPPSPAVMQALQDFDLDRLRLYPDPDARALKQALADYHGIARENVFVGNGSDEVLAHTFMAFFRQDAPLLMPNISYSFYDVYCNLYDIRYQEIPLQADFSICLEDYSQTNGGIIFANPNAPTGRALDLKEIEALLQRNTDSVVVVDEAYVDFGAQSAVALTQRYDNLLVVQTFSKSRSLAGLRIGFAMGHPDLIDGLERVKNSFNSYPLDMLAISAGVAAIEDEAYFRSTTDRIIATREWTCNELQALGFLVLPSCTNFVFAQHRYLEGAELMGYLRANGLLVRHFSRPLIDNHLRISIGTDAEMQQLIDTLQKHPDIIRLEA
ncbi:histidinol-phosphate transaminase [Marinobacterium rhizophilum]|uniref:Histidinol-phosphate aminotransferase n=1 Tax=Marinobacterium rhizophilum TaxID=420402 RepID=A0ABY5HPD1_9GAMM|nr:histidinol-phosphate transaminase [Marinobacterium rhizophilum]UTW13736.1 histidinol-phosphate transaminase [Marinobacterium rhizophilum]